MTGLRRDVIVALKNKADGGQHAFAVDSASNVPTAAPPWAIWGIGWFQA